MASTTTSSTAVCVSPLDSSGHSTYRPSASDLARNQSPQSPLDQLTSDLHPTFSSTPQESNPTPPLLNLDLFRSSICSISTASSFDPTLVDDLDSDLDHHTTFHPTDAANIPILTTDNENEVGSHSSSQVKIGLQPQFRREKEEARDDSPSTPRAVKNINYLTQQSARSRTGTEVDDKAGVTTTTSTQGFIVRSRLELVSQSATSTSSQAPAPAHVQVQAGPFVSLPRSAITKQPFELRSVPRSRNQSSPNPSPTSSPAIGSAKFSFPKPYTSPQLVTTPSFTTDTSNRPQIQTRIQPNSHFQSNPGSTRHLPRQVPGPAQMVEKTEIPVADWTSVHGEQGSDWGEDESGFEWLDTDEPEAINGIDGMGKKKHGGGIVVGLSPSKRFSKFKAAVKSNKYQHHFEHGNSGVGDSEGRSESLGVSEGANLRFSGSKKLKKPIVIPRRAAPPPPPPPLDGIESSPPPPPTILPKSPIKAKAVSHPSLKGSTTSSTSQHAKPNFTTEIGLTRSALTPRWVGNNDDNLQRSTSESPSHQPSQTARSNLDPNHRTDVFGSNRSISLPGSTSSSTVKSLKSTTTPLVKNTISSNQMGAPQMVATKLKPLPVCSLPPRTTTLGTGVLGNNGFGGGDGGMGEGSSIPINVPIKFHDGPNEEGKFSNKNVDTKRSNSRQSDFSIQSLAYSIYDLGDSSSAIGTPKSEGRGGPGGVSVTDGDGNEAEVEDGGEVSPAQQAQLGTRSGADTEVVGVARLTGSGLVIGSGARGIRGTGSHQGKASDGQDELVFPHGRYTKVSASKLDQETKMSNSIASYSFISPNPTISTLSTTNTKNNDSSANQTAFHSDSNANAFPSLQSHSNTSNLNPIDTHTYDSRTIPDLLTSAFAAQTNGDLSRAAWLFLSAAEKGSSKGRMYWGLALRYGMGVGKDEKRGCGELIKGVEMGISEGGLEGKTTTGSGIGLISSDLAMGLFELGICFLDGAGVKRTPEVGLQYLRMAATLGDLGAQEQLGMLLSKGGHGIKKDMKEAAKWYRLAVGQNSGHTFGLAWIWKEKYNE